MSGPCAPCWRCNYRNECQESRCVICGASLVDTQEMAEKEEGRSGDRRYAKGEGCERPE
jgi:hypothetical protein